VVNFDFRTLDTTAREAQGACGLRTLISVVLLLGVTSEVVAACDGTLEMKTLAQLQVNNSFTVAIGDTDHDGRMEVIVTDRNANFTDFFYRIYEHIGNDQYVVQYEGEPLEPYWVADLDGDGKSELFGQWSSSLHVFESPTPTSHPTVLTWTSPPVPNSLGPSLAADTDRDGNMEILYFSGSFFLGNLLIFECTGDNQFALVESIPSIKGGLVVADFDRDGWQEIATCGYLGAPLSYAQLRVYESPANDTWVETFRDSSGMSYPSDVGGGLDTDGNGKLEIFLSGEGQPELHRMVVWEAVANDVFTRVATLDVSDGSTGYTANAIGEMNGCPPMECILSGRDRLYVYRAAAPGVWNLEDEIVDPTPAGLYSEPLLADVNLNGRDELLWFTSSGLPSLVMEDRGAVSGVNDTPNRSLSRMTIFPNPCRGAVAALIVSTDRRGHALSVFDVAGRLVERRVPLRDAQNRPLWPVQHLTPGVYLVRLEDARGTTIGTARGVVVR